LVFGCLFDEIASGMHGIIKNLQQKIHKFTFYKLTLRCMIKSPIYCCVLALFLSCSSAKTSANNQGTADLIGTWIHVFEEDVEGVKQYRPDGYEVGPARYRERISFSKNGEVIRLNLASNDAHQDQAGRWEWEEGNTLKISLPDAEPIVWEIIQLTSESLQIKN